MTVVQRWWLATVCGTVVIWIAGIAVAGDGVATTASSTAKPAASSAAPAAKSASTTTPAAPAAKPPVPPADTSLAEMEYIELGLPATSRTWSKGDITSAAAILKALYEKQPGALPRYKSARSGPFFQQLTSQEAIEIIRLMPGPLEQRLPEVGSVMTAQNEILQLYLRAFVAKQVGVRELLDLQGTLLMTAAEAAEIADDFVASLPADDHKQEVCQQGYREMMNGFSTMVGGFLLAASDPDCYTSDDMSKILQYLDLSLTRIVPRLPADSQREVMIKIGKFTTDPQQVRYAEKWKALSAKIAAAIKSHENSKSGESGKSGESAKPAGKSPQSAVPAPTASSSASK